MVLNIQPMGQVQLTEPYLWAHRAPHSLKFSGWEAVTINVAAVSLPPDFQALQTRWHGLACRARARGVIWHMGLGSSPNPVQWARAQSSELGQGQVLIPAHWIRSRYKTQSLTWGRGCWAPSSSQGWNYVLKWLHIPDQALASCTKLGPQTRPGPQTDPTSLTEPMSPIGWAPLE